MNVLKIQHGLLVIHLTHGFGGTVLLFKSRSTVTDLRLTTIHITIAAKKPVMHTRRIASLIEWIKEIIWSIPIWYGCL
jgi:hypothetical protein